MNPFTIRDLRELRQLIHILFLLHISEIAKFHLTMIFFCSAMGVFKPKYYVYSNYCQFPRAFEWHESARYGDFTSIPAATRLHQDNRRFAQFQTTVL